MKLTLSRKDKFCAFIVTGLLIQNGIDGDALFSDPLQKALFADNLCALR